MFRTNRCRSTTLPFLAAVAALALAWEQGFAQVPAGSGDWPQWRGSYRDGVSRETGLLKQWPRGGPVVVWEVNHVGAGYSSVAVKDGRIFTQGDLDGVEHILCLRVRDGAVLWAVQPEPAARRLHQRVADALKRLDTNRDGKLDEAEATVELEWRNVGDYDTEPVAGDPSEIAAARAARLMQALDQDRDGRLSYREIRRGMGRLFPDIDTEDKIADAQALVAGRTRELFAEFDKDKDGRLTPQEAVGSFVEHTFYQIDSPLPGKDEGDRLLTPAEVTTYLLKFEKGKDGFLTAAELAAYFARVWPGRDGVLTVAELRSAYGGFRDEMGTGPRSTPTVDGDRVYALGCIGDLTCLDSATGKTLWSVNLLSEFGGRSTGRGYTESPLVDGDLLIATPGGRQGTMVALDKYTGRQVWRSTEVTDPISYASPVVADLAGVRTVVQFTSQGLIGLNARTGKLLWRYPHVSSGSANVCTPIAFKDHVFAASAYNRGGGLARVVKEEPGWKAEEVYFSKKMTNHHGGVIRVGDYAYGFTNTQLVCMNFWTGAVVWTHRSVGKGSLVCADGMLYLLGEGHRAALAEATPVGYREHGRFPVENLGRPTWSHPVVAGGRLYLRNQQRLTAYDVTDPAAKR
jgi:outer membrane protein assembly factor BamB